MVYTLSIGNNQQTEWKLKELARKGTGGDAYTVIVEGDYCYVSCGYSGFRIFDISSLSNPKQVANLPQPGDGYAHQFILENNVAYIGNGYGGIWMINCTDPENPTEIMEFSNDYAWDFQIMDDLIYGGNGFTGGGEKITITNISEVTNPEHISSVPTTDDVTDLQRVNDKLYAACSREGFQVFDISNRTNPIHLGTYIDPNNPDIYLTSFEVVENYAYVCYWQHGMKILNIENSSEIIKVSELTNSSSDAYSIHIIEDLAYIADIAGGIQVVNVSSVMNPVEQHRYIYDNCGTNDIFKQDEILFIADRNIGLIIFQIGSDEVSPFGFDIYSVIILSISITIYRKRFRNKNPVIQKKSYK
jgi:hypothetical protein